jgi:hypothetical protein
LVKVVRPSRLLEEAAHTLREVKDEVVVVGAAAIEVALHAVPATITPTRDVDLVVNAIDVDAVVRHLEEADLRPSTIEYERNFTWVRGDFKVQLIRGFHPFPSDAGKGLPVNPTADSARNRAHREEVAFELASEQVRLWVATPACLVALKQNAFGRTRPPDNEVVRRDFHDVCLLIAHVPDQVLDSYCIAEGGIRQGVRSGVMLLCDPDGEPLRLAAAEMVSLGEARNQRDAEAEILLTMRDFSKRL